MIRAGLRTLRLSPEAEAPPRSVRARFARALSSAVIAARRSDAAPIIRHAALCAAAVSAWVFRFEIRAGNDLLLVIAGAAAVNLTAQIVASRPSMKRTGLWLSSAGGIAGWSLLGWMTGGVTSPFFAGYALEIVLAAFSFPGTGVAAVTLGAVGILAAQQALLRPIASGAGALFLHTSVLLVLGGATILLLRRLQRAGEDLSEERARLRALEEEIGTARAVGRVGENAARMAHGLKNAVHGLRGFGALLEEEAGGRREQPSALEGLRAAIEEVEAMARMILVVPVAAPRVPEDVACEGVGRALDRAAATLARTSPGVRWSCSTPPMLPATQFPESELREVFETLLRNAAEAMRGKGLITVETRVEDEWIRILVRDEGPGIPRAGVVEMAKPGFTTKPQGSGFGLYLARRLLESRGGRLEASARPGRGAEFRVHLPVSPACVRRGEP